MTPFFAVLRVVNVLPHVHVTLVSTYSGWMSGFTAAPVVCRSPGRPARFEAGREPVPALQCARRTTTGRVALSRLPGFATQPVGTLRSGADRAPVVATRGGRRPLTAP